jgi:Ca-activated chloride channel family protein
VGRIHAFAIVAFVTSMVVIDAAQQERARFRAGVDLISLSVTVTDPNRRYVTDLDRDDFIVTENGVAQPLTFFGKRGIPLALAILIDSSASMEAAMGRAQEAAAGFVRQLGAEDVATIVDFDSRVQIAQGFTGDHELLESAIRQTQAGGSTALHNAVYIALRELGKRMALDDPDAPRRRAIVVLSDGEDTSSLVSFEELLDAASRSDAVIYTIGLGIRDAVPVRGGQDGQFVLRRLAQQTGGRAFFPADVKDLADVYADIRSELASQYLLAYESRNGVTNGQWRNVAVRVKREGATVRTRQGYFAPRK